MKKIIHTIFALFAFQLVHAQSQIPIPDTLSGNSINLSIAEGTKQFFSGFNTKTIGYNGSYLGPTIILNKGQNVTLNVHNQLTDTTTTHWHGLHVAPTNDGSPHNPILAGNTWSPSFEVMDNAAMYWYHPHLHGKTMDQVLKGAAGLIIVRDDVETALTLPRTYGVDDIPLVFQWQTFDNTTKQIVLNDELDNTTLVNGTVNGYVNIPAQVVRLRLLNASSHRFFEFGFSDNRTFNQITSDDGLLNAPVPMTRLMLGSGERAEILVNFSGQTGQTFFIKQFGTQLPAGYPGGPAGMMGGTLGPLDNTNFNLLQINVQAPTANAITTIPLSLTSNTVYSTLGASNFNVLITASPAMSMTNFLMNGVKYDMNVINMTTSLNTVMTWTITNQSMMPHPFHIHGNHFYVLSVNGSAPAPNLQGRKDVVVVPPNGGVVKLITKYNDYGNSQTPFMFHCHILSHEDNGMMGQFIVTPANTTGLPNLDKTKNMVLTYPNPVSEKLFIDLPETVSFEHYKYKIINSNGIVVISSLFSTQNVIDVTSLSSGFYHLVIETNNSSLVGKFIKK
jgi:blue copper oxidase